MPEHAPSWPLHLDHSMQPVQRKPSPLERGGTLSGEAAAGKVRAAAGAMYAAAGCMHLHPVALWYVQSVRCEGAWRVIKARSLMPLR